MMYGAPVPLGKVPILQVMMLPTGVAQPVTSVTPAGSVSVNTTPVAVDGPRLVTVMEYVSTLPALTGSGESAMSTPRSAAGLTLIK